MKPLILLILVCFGILSCGKKCRTFYEFLVPVSVYPIKDTLQINDTIHFELNFSDEVYDYKSQKHYKLEDFDFKLAVLINEFVSDTIVNTNQPGAINKFTVFNIQGHFYDWSHPALGWGNIKPEYENNRYLFKGGFIPKEAGLFRIYIINDIHPSREPEIKVTNSKCTEWIHFMRIQVNNGKNNNHLIEGKTRFRCHPEGCTDEQTQWQDKMQGLHFYVK